MPHDPARARARVRAQNGHTPLHFASAHGHTRLLSALIDLKADPNAKDKVRCMFIHSISRQAWKWPRRLGARCSAAAARGGPTLRDGPQARVQVVRVVQVAQASLRRVCAHAGRARGRKRFLGDPAC